MKALTDAERELIERALDTMYDLVMGEELTGAAVLKANKLYVQAVAIVRDRPAGARKIRSDFLTERGPRPRRPTSGEIQGEIPV